MSVSAVTPDVTLARLVPAVIARADADLGGPDKQTKRIASGSIVFGTIHAGGHTYGTARFTYCRGGCVAYYLAANDVVVHLVFSAQVILTGDTAGRAKLAQAQAAFAAVRFLPRPPRLKSGLPLLQSVVGALLILLLFLTASILLLVRKLATTGRLILGLLVVAVVLSLLAHLALNWLTASLVLASWVTLLGHLLAWPVRVLVARRGSGRG